MHEGVRIENTCVIRRGHKEASSDQERTRDRNMSKCGSQRTMVIAEKNSKNAQRHCRGKKKVSQQLDKVMRVIGPTAALRSSSVQKRSFEHRLRSE